MLEVGRERETFSVEFEDTTYKKSNGILLANIKIATMAGKKKFTLERTVAILKIIFMYVLLTIIATVYSYS